MVLGGSGAAPPPAPPTTLLVPAPSRAISSRWRVVLGGSGAAPPPAPPTTLLVPAPSRAIGSRSRMVLGGSGAAPPPAPPTTLLIPPPPTATLTGAVGPTLLEDRLELKLAANRGVGLHHLETGHRVVVDVAVGIEAPLSVDAVEVLGGRDRLAHRLPLLGYVLGALDCGGRALDPVDRDPARLRSVEGVGGGLLPEPLLVLLVGLGPDPLHLLEGEAGEG